MVRVGVGLDPLVALRGALGGKDPDLVAAVHEMRLGGADHVLVRLTEAKRPVGERDLRLLVEAGTLPVVVEIEAKAALVAWAIAAKPAGVVIVEPDAPARGLALEGDVSAIEKSHGDLRDAGLAVALAVEPGEKALVGATGVGAETVELVTAKFAAAPAADARVVALAALAKAASTARTLGMRVRAGGGLDESSVERVASLEEVEVVTVGRSVLARAVFLGLRAATALFVERARGTRPPQEGPSEPSPS